MSKNEQVAKVAELIKSLKEDLGKLEAAGSDIPAVVKNVVRMKGSLRQLEVQFVDLDNL